MKKRKIDFMVFLFTIIIITIYGMKIITNFYIAAVPIIALTIYMYIKYLYIYSKINIYLIFLIAILIISILFRPYTDYEQLVFYIITLLSPYAFCMINWDKKNIRIISTIFAIVSMITPFFNGFLSEGNISGKAFDGRLLPFFYLIFSLLGLKYSERFKEKVLFYIALVFNLYGVFWSNSRIAIVATIFLIFINLVSNKIRINKKTKNVLLTIYIIVIILQALVPYIYIYLSQNFYNELNELSYKLTEKNFFTGREILWDNIIRDINSNFITGTSDTNYTSYKLTAHNELIGRAYIWGGLSAIFLIMYNFKIIKRCIKNISDEHEKLIIFSIIAIILCSSFETFMYTPTGYMYYSILISMLLKKEMRGRECNLKKL